MKKKLLTLLCVLTCVLSLTACGGGKAYTDFEMSKIENCETIANFSLQLVMQISPKTASEISSMYNKEEMATLYSESIYGGFGATVQAELGAFDGLLTTYNQMVSDMGGLVSTGNTTSEIVGDEIVVTTAMYGNECDGSITFTFSNDIFSKFIEGDAVANTSFAQKLHNAGSNMGTAGMNTLLGMGTVFVMLIVISFIISSFSLLGKIGKKEPKKEEAVKNEAPVETVTEEDLTDDTELVAVIMAAIKAYEGNASTDGFVVRSIKKANRRI